MPPATQPPIDFEALAEIDREIDRLLDAGAWTRERYEELRQKALAAVGGHDVGLSFIDSVAEREWRSGLAALAPKMARLPRPTREVVRMLLGGWQPYVALPVGRALEWNGRDVAAVRVEVDFRASGSRVTAQVDPQEVEIDQPFRVEIIRDRLRVKLAHGWTLRSDNAHVRHRRVLTRPGMATGTLDFVAHGAAVSRGEVAPIVWVIPLDVGHSLPIGNVDVERELVGADDGRSFSSGWGGFRFEGAYPYVLVESKAEGEKRSIALVVETPGQPLDAIRVHQDLFALQFVLGQRVGAGLAFGLDGTDRLVVSSGPLDEGRSKNAYQVIGSWPDAPERTAEFFSRLSVALRTPEHTGILRAVHRVLRSHDGLLDLAIQDLLLAVASLTAARDDLAQLPHGSRAKSFLAVSGITLPTEIVGRIDDASRALASRGALADDQSSDASVRSQIDIKEELRSVVVAIIALTVGYRGPFVGHQASEQPPAWWPTCTIPPSASFWTDAAPPEDLTHGLREGEILVLVEDPDHVAIIRWLLHAADMTEHVRVAAAWSRGDLQEHVKRLLSLGDRLIVIANVARGHVPTASARLRDEFALGTSSVEAVPAVPCVEAWMLADDELVAAQTDDVELRRRAMEPLPDEVDDPRSLAHMIFGPPADWPKVSPPDIYRAADRSPSLRHFLDVVAKRLGVEADLPARSVARGLSRDAIAGLIRSLLADDDVAWRTSDGNAYTAADLAREIEQGTSVGRQYSVDLVSMMINALARRARHAKSA